MVDLAAKLRERGRELGLADAEVARRAGLTAPRYGHYVAGTRRPDYDTLLRLCRVLATTPDRLLGFAPEAPAAGPRAGLEAELALQARTLADDDLLLLVKQARLLAEHRRRTGPDGDS